MPSGVFARCDIAWYLLFIIFIQITDIFLIFTRSHAVNSLKRAVKGALTRKAGVYENVGDCVVSAAYLAGGVFRTDKGQIVRQADFDFI